MNVALLMPNQGKFKQQDSLLSCAEPLALGPALGAYKKHVFNFQKEEIKITLSKIIFSPDFLVP